jgi:RNA polymerase sigma factor (sigma-70 family)
MKRPEEDLVTNGTVFSLDESNEDLLRRCECGDESALRELLRRHERHVYAVLYRMLGCHEDAEEALADVFVKVWRAASSFRGAAKFTTWLHRLAGNTALDMLRSRKSRPEVNVEDVVLTEMVVDSSEAVDPEQVLVRAEDMATVDRALQKLSPEDRLLVTLYHIRECSLEEIAEITGKNRTNLKVKLFRARQKLRVHLGELDRETNHEMQKSTTESIGLQPGAAESAASQ